MIIVAALVLAAGAAAGPPIGRGTAVLVVAHGDAQWLVARDLETGTSWPLTRTAASDDRPVWSPDGRRVAFVRQSDMAASAVYVVDAGRAGAPHRPLLVGVRRPWWDGITWSPNGRSLVLHLAAARDALYRLPAGGGRAELVERMPAGEPQGQLRLLDWSATGRLLVAHWQRMGRSEDGVGPVSLEIVSQDGGGATRLFGTALLLDAKWSPDGRRIAYVSGCWFGEPGPCRLGVVDPATHVRRPLRTLSPRGNPQQRDEANVISIAWRPAHSTLVYGRDGVVYELSIDTGATRVVARIRCPFASCEATQTDLGPISRDGSRVVVHADFVSMDETCCSSERWYVVSLKNGSVTALRVPSDAVAVTLTRLR